MAAKKPRARKPANPHADWKGGMRMAITAPVDLADAKPAAGAIAKRQPSGNTYGRVGSGICSTIGQLLGNLGYAEPPPGTFEVYRKIKSNPTVALAYAATVYPVQFAPWTYEAADGTPDEWVEFAQDQMDAIKWDFVQQACRRFYYGFQAFERVYDVKDGRLGIERLKPLMPDITRPIVDEFGTIIGLENGGAKFGQGNREPVRLTVDKIVWTTFDSEGDDPFGRSVLENVRDVWSNWCSGARNLGKYVTKNAGIIPVVIYPYDTQAWNDGQLMDAQLAAQRVIDSLWSANGIAMPMKVADVFAGVAQEILRNGGDIQQLLAYQIKTLDFKSGAGAEIIDAMKHDEALMVRGMLRPERSLLESENGSRADAVQHTDTGLATSDMLHHENCEYATGILDDLLVANWGEKARGAVKVMPGALTSEERDFFRDLAKAVIAAHPDLLYATTDIDALWDKAGIPKSREVIDLEVVQPKALPPGEDGQDGGDGPDDSGKPDPSRMDPPPGRRGSADAKMSGGARAIVARVRRVATLPD